MIYKYMYENGDIYIEDKENKKNKDFENISTLKNKPINKEEYPTLLDQIICQYGYGIELWKIIICIIFIYIICGYSGTIYATLITAYTKKFNLTDAEVSSIGMVYFVSKALGALFSGYFSKLLNGRVVLVNFSIFLILLTNVQLSYIPTKEMLFTERILSGGFCGIIEPIINNLLCEYLPIKLRGFFLLSVWIGYNIGQLFPNLIMLGVMPHYEPSEISKLLLLSCPLIFLCWIFSFIYLKDSARNYILHNQTDKGMQVLEKITPENKLSEENKHRILKEVKEGINKDISSSEPWDVFKKEYIFLTICISAISFLSNFIYDGPVLIMNLTLSSFANDDKDEDNILSNAIFIIVCSIPSSLIGGISLEISFFGRKWTMFYAFLFLLISLILAMLNTNYIHIYLGIYQFFASYCSIMAGIYASEVFPSKIRDFSVGLSTFFSYAASAISQYVFIALNKYNKLSPYYFSIVCCLIGCIICTVLTVDTFQRPLDKVDGIENDDGNEIGAKNITNLSCDDDRIMLLNKD